MEDVAGSLVVVQRGTLEERVSSRLAVFGSVGDRAGQYKYRGEVAVFAVADTHIDPEKGFVGEGVVPAVGREAEAPASSFVPCLDSMRPDPGQVVEGA